jgi:hypothetical protein
MQPLMRNVAILPHQCAAVLRELPLAGDDARLNDRSVISPLARCA